VGRSKQADRQRSWAVAGSVTGSRAVVKAGRDGGRNRLKPVLLRLEDRRLLTTFTVTNTFDSLSSGYPTTGTLRWAVEQADQAGGNEVIDFDSTVFDTPQTITITQIDAPIEIGPESASITINGPGANLLTINPSSLGGAFQVDSSATATISGLTITNASLEPQPNGAVSDFGTLNLSNCTFTNNTISAVYVTGKATITDCTMTGGDSYFGAGVYVKSGTATISNCTIENNVGSFNAVGAAICNQGTATVTDCTLSDNSALGGGGALYNSDQLTVTDCTISGNTGGGGGSLYNKSGTAYLSGCTISGGSGFIDGGNLDNQYGAKLTLANCTINSGSAEIGGGLYNAGNATLTDCTISNNIATGSSGGGQGGGISNGPLQSKAVLTLTNSTLVGNTAKLGGGGLYNNGTATLTDSTIANNFANQAGSLLASNGGGVDTDGTATLVACTISGNTTTAAGGGLYNGGLGASQATLTDTIVAGNTISGGGASDIAISTNNGVDVTGSYNLIGTGGSGGLSSPNNQFGVGNPGLAPLADYGGPTQTMALLPSSPAIGAGTTADGPGTTIPITTDQRGFPLDSPHPDVGTFQTQPSGSLVVTATSDNGAPAGLLDLRGAVDLADIQSKATTITFDTTVFATPQTITLTAGPLALSNTSAATTINGPTAGVTVSGGGASRVFQVGTGVTATISGLTITGASTTGKGGGVYNDGGTAHLSDCTIIGNSAALGGGVANYGTATLDDCTISGNSAGTSGGGVLNGSTATLDDCTIFGNSAGTSGGGVQNGGTATLTGTIVAGNTSGTGSDVHGANVTGTYNLIGTGGSGGLVNGQNGNLVGVANPLLAPLGNYGGPTQTMALLPGSPAIGAGTSISGITTDQRGKPLDAPNPDIGAFQSQGFTLTAAGGTSQRAGTGDAFANPLSVTVTAKNAAEPVAGGVATFTAPSSGASANLSGTTATIGSNGVASVTATANATGGSYTVTASAVGSAQTIDFNLTNLISLTFSGVTGQSITYGTSSVLVSGTLANGGQTPLGESVVVTLNGVPQAATIGTGGAFSTTFDVTSLSVSHSPYTISYAYTSDYPTGDFASASTTSTLTVSPATLTIAADSEPKVYGTSDPALAYTASGFQFNDTAASVLTGHLTRAQSGTLAGEQVGGYAINQGTLAASSNYTISFTGNTLTITPATLTVTANPLTKVYGTNDPTLTDTMGGLVNATVDGVAIDDTAASVLTGHLTRSQSGTLAGEQAGGYAINQGTLAASGNYTISFTGNTLTITPATLTVTAKAQTKVYGTNDPTLTDTIKGLLNVTVDGVVIDDVGATVLTGSLGRSQSGTLAGEQGGGYAINQGTLVASGNYAISFIGNTLTITPAPLTVTANSPTKVYGTNDPTLTVTTGGLIDTTVDGVAIDDTAASVLTGHLTRSQSGTLAGEQGGGYAINQGTLAADSSYTISFTGGTLTITPAALTVTANPLTKVYGAIDPTLTDTTEGLVNTTVDGVAIDDTAASVLTGHLTRASGETVAGGPYAINQGTLAAGSNYTISFTGSTLTITPATLTIAAKPETKVYGAADPTLAYTASGLQFTDTAAEVVSGLLSRAAGETVAGGPYAISQGNLTANSNYTISFMGNSLSITPATPAVNVRDADGAYNGSSFAATATITGVDGIAASSLESVTLTLSYYTGSTATGTPLTGAPSGTGTYTAEASFAGSADYSATSNTATFTIAPATPKLSVSDAGGTYSGSSFKASATVVGISGTAGSSLGGVTPTLTYYVGSGTSGTNLGSTPPTAAGTYTVVASFPAITDYAATQSKPTTFVIARAAATIALNSSGGSAVYGQAVTFVATVNSGVGTPGGTVTFSDGATPLATVPLDGSGKATLTTTGLAIGSHSITATYNGDSTFLGVQSGTTSESVTQASTAIVFVPQPVFNKKKKVISVILAAEVEPQSSGSSVPTGTVTFELVKKIKKKVKVTTLGTVAVNGGDAMLTVKSKSVLNKPITIHYTGDTNYTASTATPPALTQQSLKSLARPMVALLHRGHARPQALSPRALEVDQFASWALAHQNLHP
jgi:hypothetical protein